MFRLPPRLRATLAAGLAACLGAAPGSVQAQISPCDDVNYARDFRTRYPAELNKLFDLERTQQAAWSARGAAIGDRVVAVGAGTPDSQRALVLALGHGGQHQALDAQAQKYADEFRLRNDSLQATPLIALLDPFRPNRAWCLLATQALESATAKVNVEIESWSLLDRELLAAAAARGVTFTN